MPELSANELKSANLVVSNNAEVTPEAAYTNKQIRTKTKIRHTTVKLFVFGVFFFRHRDVGFCNRFPETSVNLSYYSSHMRLHNTI